MVYRRHSVISQPALPGMASDPLVEWMRLHRRPKERNRKRPTAAEKRLEEARRDPRQVSIFGDEHTRDLQDTK